MRPTNYRAQWYVLRFKADPRLCLAQLPMQEFRLVRVSEIAKVANLSSVVEKASHLLPKGWDSLPLSWPESLDSVPLEHLSGSRAPLHSAAEG